jgi:tetratricopeptide (TPR) repeat protein
MVEPQLLIAEVRVKTAPAQARELVTKLLARADIEPHRPQLLPLLVALRMNEEAAPVLASLREQNPQNVELLRLQSAVELDGGEPAKAAATLESMLGIEPRDPLALENLTRIYEVLGDRGKTQNALTRLLDVNPSNQAARRSIVRMLSEDGADEAALAKHRTLLAFYEKRAEAAKLPPAKSRR